MRLWSIHPKYLDQKGLVALWREGLLAQEVLCGKTKGYRNHPQLNRFKELKEPISEIGTYLNHVYQEAKRRGYNFNKIKILKWRRSRAFQINVTRQQLYFEMDHLKNKLRKRDPQQFKVVKNLKRISPNPLFKTVNGKIENWERIVNEKTS